MTRRAAAVVAVTLTVASAVAGVSLVASWVTVRTDGCSGSAWSGEPLDLPPSAVGRRDAEVLDVDVVEEPGRPRYATADVTYEVAGRETVVTWVDVVHLDPLPQVGDVLPVAYVPTDAELAFHLDDPGLSDPQGNGYLAYRTPALAEPSCPAVPPLLTGAAVAGAVTVLTAPLAAGLLAGTRSGPAPARRGARRVAT